MTSSYPLERGWYSNPEARGFRVPADPAGESARSFHRTVPGYAPTRLVDVPELAERWRVGRVFVKEESQRFGLPAFKALGASWAIARVLTERAGRSALPTYDDAVTAALAQPLTLVTATDGNHGRAVAHFAGRLGLRAVIVIPTFVGGHVAHAIEDEGAEVLRVGGSYDDAVREAATVAGASPDRVLVQDMGWPGYETVPGWIVQGYVSMPAETDEQLAALGLGRPDLVAVPVGVGSLAQAVVGHYRGAATAAGAAVLSCEPDSAACLLASLRAGEPVTVPTGDTVMAGLNCGTVSSAAWPVLQGGVDAAVAVTDEEAVHAVARLADLGVDAGASGAATLAGVEAALTGPGAGEHRAELGLGEESVVVLLSTEGGAGAGGLTSPDGAR